MPSSTAFTDDELLQLFKAKADLTGLTPEEITRLDALTTHLDSPQHITGPTDYWGGVRKSLGETALATGRGILHGAADSINPMAIAKGIYGTGKDLLTNKGEGTISGLRAIASGDPEAGGRAIGGLLVGGAAPRVLPKLPMGLVKVGSGMEKLGEAAKPVTPFGVAEAAVRMDPKGLAVAAAPYITKGAGTLIRRGGEVMGGNRTPEVPFSQKPLALQMDSLPDTPAPLTTRTGMEPYRPGQAPTPFHELPLAAQMEGLPHRNSTGSLGNMAPERTRAGMEPYRPSTSSTEVPISSRLPPPRHVGPAPTVEDELLKALESARSPESPEVMTGAPDVETAGEGALKQSGKFGKSGSLGQAGGYTSGNPATPAFEEAAPAHDAVLENAAPIPEAAGEPAPWDPSWAGSEEPSSPFHGTENPEWHSGAEPGSPEARQAQSSHQYEREMDDGYRRRLLDSRGSVSTEDMIKLLLGGLAGGAVAGSTSQRP